MERERNAQLTVRIHELEADLQDKQQVRHKRTHTRTRVPCMPVIISTCNYVFQELENLRKQAEIIPQLMSECESITDKLQVN